jgi:hypothetical protein
MKNKDVELLSPAREPARTTSLVVWRFGLEARCRVSPEGTGNVRRLRPRNNPSWLRERLEASRPRRALSGFQPLPPDSPHASKVLCTPFYCHCPSTYPVLPSIVVPAPSRASPTCSPGLPGSRTHRSRTKNFFKCSRRRLTLYDLSFLRCEPYSNGLFPLHSKWGAVDTASVKRPETRHFPKRDGRRSHSKSWEQDDLSCKRDRPDKKDRDKPLRVSRDRPARDSLTPPARRSLLHMVIARKGRMGLPDCFGRACFL